LIYNNCSEQTE